MNGLPKPLFATDEQGRSTHSGARSPMRQAMPMRMLIWPTRSCTWGRPADRRERGLRELRRRGCRGGVRVRGQTRHNRAGSAACAAQILLNCQTPQLVGRLTRCPGSSPRADIRMGHRLIPCFLWSCERESKGIALRRGKCPNYAAPDSTLPSTRDGQSEGAACQRVESLLRWMLVPLMVDLPQGIQTSAMMAREPEELSWAKRN